MCHDLIRRKATKIADYYTGAHCTVKLNLHAALHNTPQRNDTMGFNDLLEFLISKPILVLWETILGQSTPREQPRPAQMQMFDEKFVNAAVIGAAILGIILVSFSILIWATKKLVFKCSRKQVVVAPRNSAVNITNKFNTRQRANSENSKSSTTNSYMKSNNEIRRSIELGPGKFKWSQDFTRELFKPVPRFNTKTHQNGHSWDNSSSGSITPPATKTNSDNANTSAKTTVLEPTPANAMSTVTTNGQQIILITPTLQPFRAN